MKVLAIILTMMPIKLAHGEVVIKSDGTSRPRSKAEEGFSGLMLD